MTRKKDPHRNFSQLLAFGKLLKLLKKEFIIFYDGARIEY